MQYVVIFFISLVLESGIHHRQWSKVPRAFRADQLAPLQKECDRQVQ